MAGRSLAAHPWRVDIFVTERKGQRIPKSLVGSCYFPSEQEGIIWADLYNDDLRPSTDVWATHPVYSDSDAYFREKRLLEKAVMKVEIDIAETKAAQEGRL